MRDAVAFDRESGTRMIIDLKQAASVRRMNVPKLIAELSLSLVQVGLGSGEEDGLPQKLSCVVSINAVGNDFRPHRSC